MSEDLEKRGVTFEATSHPETYTSVDEARALGIAADEVLKAVMLNTASGYRLAVVPASRRLDMKLVEKALGDKHARLATEQELELDFPGYELGALPPLGSLLSVPTYVDPEVMGHEMIVFAAGSRTDSVKVRTKDLFRDEPVSISPLTRHPEEEEERGGLSR
ncbi:MAG TPA: YbaK/EbsC family protein [Solirubrobacterales bacterium]|nr:YbaK/EbsC family protein [Solirubrobacterales bacterium]